MPLSNDELDQQVLRYLRGYDGGWVGFSELDAANHGRLGDRNNVTASLRRLKRAGRAANRPNEHGASDWRAR